MGIIKLNDDEWSHSSDDGSGYLEYGDTLAEKVRKSKERKKEQESKMNNKIALWTFIVGIISMLIGAIALLISHDMREIILPILGK